MIKRSTISYQEIFELLKRSGGKTLEDISQATGRSVKTLRYGVRVLTDANMLTVKLHPRDLRLRVYYLKPEYMEVACPIQH